MPLEPGPYYIDTDLVVSGIAVQIFETGQFLFVAAGVNCGSFANHDGVKATAEHTNSTIHGTVLSVAGNAFHATGDFTNLTVAAGGAISAGLIGVWCQSAGNSIFNAGSITGASGVVIAEVAGDNTLVNSGQIVGSVQAGVVMNSGNNTILNSGLIAGKLDGIHFNSNGAAPNSIDNSGTIRGGGDAFAISSGSAVLSVTNSGRIVGGVNFGSLDDSYDGSLGDVVGNVYGNGGDDTLTGGAGADHFVGGAGSDTLEGGGGSDWFIYNNASQSGGGTHDTVADFNARADRFDLSVTVTGIDAKVASGQLREANFAHDVENAVGAGALAAGHAVLFTPDAGDLAGHTILVVDADGVAGFTRGADYVFDITDATNLGRLSTHTFT